MNNQIKIPNIDIKEITLINSDPDVASTAPMVSFTVFPRDKNEPIIFDSLVLDEDMFAESVTGTLYFYDPAFIIEQLNFTSYDIIKIIYAEPGGTSKTCQFRIVEIASEANSVSKEVLGPFGNTIPVAIKFTSDQLIYKNFDTMLLKSFIGRISNNSRTPAPYTSQVPGLEKACGKIDGPGFVQYVFEQFGFGKNVGGDAPKKLEADATFNDVWFKVNPSHYPWSKIGVPAKIGQMMNYVCEYACYLKNPNAVNFFFWEDLDKFNFKCIESLLQDKTPKATYTPSLNENDIDAIADLQIIAETPVAKLVDNGAFSSEYVRIKPDWGNPYKFVVDTAEALKRTQVVYDYYTDKGFKKIATYPPIDQKDVSVVYSPNRISDSNYGYFQDAYGQGNRPWWNYWDSSYKHFDGEKIGGVTSEVERIEGNYWQSQFDFCELPASCLKKIYEKIKWPRSAARAAYSKMKRADTKWKFYRQTILGERNQPTSFYALLLGTTNIYNNDAGGIYRYSFQEVEFWPKRSNGYRNSRSVQRVISDANYPFTIVTVPWGIKGEAYNLNELLNVALPLQDESDRTIKTALISPGASTKVSEDGTVDGIIMQPVGQFRVRSTGDGEDPKDEYVGRVVKIDVISSKMVDMLIPATSFPCGFPIKQEVGPIFVFDVENSGVCATSTV